MQYSDFYNFLINEAFDTVADFLLNPEHDETEWYELIKKFKDNGGKVLGTGTHATVFEHPSWKYVLKVFSEDQAYLRYVRFCLKHPRPSFPVFYDKPRRIVPFFKRYIDQTHLYVVKTEKLYPITSDEYIDIKRYLDQHHEFVDAKMAEFPDNQTWSNVKTLLLNLEKQYPCLPQLKADYQFLKQSNIEFKIGYFDEHSGNIMKRENGDFVLSDPFWSKGQISKSAQYWRSKKANRGMVKGGELPTSADVDEPVITMQSKPTPSQVSTKTPYGDDFAVNA